MRWTAGAKAVGDGQKVRLEDRLQDQLGPRLDHPISDRRDSQRAVPAVRLRDQFQPHRLRTIAFPLQVVVQVFHKRTRSRLNRKGAKGAKFFGWRDEGISTSFGHQPAEIGVRNEPQRLWFGTAIRWGSQAHPNLPG